jgi:hypothetical protein
MTNNDFFSHLRKHGVTKTDYRVLQGLPVKKVPSIADGERSVCNLARGAIPKFSSQSQEVCGVMALHTIN